MLGPALPELLPRRRKWKQLGSSQAPHAGDEFLDPDDLDRSPGRMAGVKTGLCARCEARGKCMHDLDDEFADPGWGDWRNYCPNATRLSLLSTLRACDEEEQPASREADQPSA